MKKELEKQILEIYRLTGNSKPALVVIIFACVIFGIALSFLLVWPVTIFANYIIVLFGGVGALKVWHVWFTITILNILFRRGK